MTKKSKRQIVERQEEEMKQKVAKAEVLPVERMMQYSFMEASLAQKSQVGIEMEVDPIKQLRMTLQGEFGLLRSQLWAVAASFQEQYEREHRSDSTDDAVSGGESDS